MRHVCFRACRCERDPSAQPEPDLLGNARLLSSAVLRRRPRDEKRAAPVLICVHDSLLFCITQCSLQPDKPIRLYEPLWAAALPAPLIRGGELSSASAQPICTVSMNI